MKITNNQITALNILADNGHIEEMVSEKGATLRGTAIGIITRSLEKRELIKQGKDGIELTEAGYEAIDRKPKAKKGLNTKTQLVVGLMKRDCGVTISEMVEATGWKRVAVRSAISRIKRKTGLAIKSEFKVVDTTDRRKSIKVYQIKA